jgi:hypothetical protein
MEKDGDRLVEKFVQMKMRELSKLVLQYGEEYEPGWWYWKQWVYLAVLNGGALCLK